MIDWKMFPKIVVVFVFSGALFLTGCGSNGSASGDAVDGYYSADSVSLMKATAEDISDYRVECSNKKEKKICISICHKPPGNPENSKSKVLPLSAVLAHLKHGGPNHGDHDVLGPCDGDDEDDMEEMEEMDEDPNDDVGNEDEDSGDNTGSDEGSSSDDSASGGGASDDGSSSDDSASGGGASDDGSDSEEGPMPQYCQDNLDLDADCDGLSDQDDSFLY